MNIKVIPILKHILQPVVLPPASYIDPSIQSEDDWVDKESSKRLIADVKKSQDVMICYMLILGLVLYGTTPNVILMIWFVAGIIFSLVRSAILNKFIDATESRKEYLFNFYVNIAPISGLIWGLALFLFNGKASVNVLVFSFILVATFGLFSAPTLFSNLRILRHFLYYYTVGLLISIITHIVAEQDSYLENTQLWLLILVCVFSSMIYRIGEFMNAPYIDWLRIQYQNQKIIISLQKETDKALAAVASKNRLFASAAHDMRQPVLALKLYNNWLGESPKDATEISPKIAESTGAVLDLFDSMFNISKLAQGQITVNNEPINLKKLIDSLIVQYEPIAALKKLKIRLRVQDVDINSDPILLKRVLGNLIGNAIKYTKKGGILVVCRNTKEGVEIGVWDTGIVIARAQQTMVFGEFYKGTDFIGTNDGFGLGLSIVSQFVELLGGRVDLQSRQKRGTVVRLLLR
jgi:signal transduction histidine kinase